MSKYRKLVAAVIGALLVTMRLVWDLSVTEQEAEVILASWAAALGVWWFPNDGLDVQAIIDDAYTAGRQKKAKPSAS